MRSRTAAALARMRCSGIVTMPLVEPKGEACIRVQLSGEHTGAQIDQAVGAFATVGKRAKALVAMKDRVRDITKRSGGRSISAVINGCAAT